MVQIQRQLLLRPQALRLVLRTYHQDTNCLEEHRVPNPSAQAVTHEVQPAEPDTLDVTVLPACGDGNLLLGNPTEILDRRAKRDQLFSSHSLPAKAGSEAMRFTVRDLFLVTMIVAILLGWWADRSSVNARLTKELEWRSGLEQLRDVDPDKKFFVEHLHKSKAPAPNPPKP